LKVIEYQKELPEILQICLRCFTMTFAPRQESWAYASVCCRELSLIDASGYWRHRIV